MDLNASELNKKIFTDSYIRLLNCKESNALEAVHVLPNLARQIDKHSISLNLPSHSAEYLKSEIYEEYFSIIDNEKCDDLLPVLKDELFKNKNKKIEPINIHGMKNVIEEVKTCLCKLKVSGNPFLNEINQSTTNIQQKPLNSYKNICNSNIAIKRPAQDEAVSSVSGNKSKRNFNSKISVKAKNLIASEQAKSGTAFKSAKSMYKNPMKKFAEEEESRKCDKSDQKSTEDECLKNFDKKIVDVIFNEIMDFSPNIKWTDIAGLEFVKTTVQEIVIWPLLRPDIFTGLRAPPRGILLFGPPGTGKTLIGKCIATESNSTFFCISASSLASKWVGESEQLVRALFTIARLNQPAVIFVDEIDSLLSQRSDKDQDFTRKLKTEFLVQFDGAKTNSEERILVVGATNRPHELDEAARRRFVKRLYVPLPEVSARRQIIQKLMSAQQHSLCEADLQKICDETKGYSGSDVTHLCKEAAMGPIRCIGPENIKTISLDQVRAISLADFTDALRQVRASVAQDDLNYYFEWNKTFGSFG